MPKASRYLVEGHTYHRTRTECLPVFIIIALTLLSCLTIASAAEPTNLRCTSVASPQKELYKPDAQDMCTFTTIERRFDWVLVSADLQFLSYETIDYGLSDHKAAVVTIAIAER